MTMQSPTGGKSSKAAAVAVTEFDKTLDGSSSYAPSSDPAAKDRSRRRCSADAAMTEQCLLTANPAVLLNLLCYDLNPRDLAALEATCKFFRNPADLPPDTALSLPELAAYDMCRRKATFRGMEHEEMKLLKRRCGGSWKLVLDYALVGEKNYRRGKPQVVAGSGHSIVVTAKGDVYSFGENSLGQLGLGNIEDQLKPCLIRSLQGVRITQATVGTRRTMLVSDTGSVYTFGHDILGWENTVAAGAVTSHCSSPKLVESLRGVFVVQASMGSFFTAVLSREGRVYTFCWGRGNQRLGHNTDPADVEPRLLSGPYGDAPVVQIAAGNCFLLLLVYRPNGMSVYSVGCGMGGKLGHGTKENEGIPRLMEHFETPDTRPLSISAGPFHAAVLGCDGSVFTWGWNTNGCLGHDNSVAEEGGGGEYTAVPTAVEGSLRGVKAVHVLAGRYTTFVVASDGAVYSFGMGYSLNLGFLQDKGENVLSPKLATSLAGLGEKVVQISATQTYDWQNNDPCFSHTLVLTESGKLYALGAGVQGQLGLGIKRVVVCPSRVPLDIV